MRNRIDFYTIINKKFLSLFRLCFWIILINSFSYADIPSDERDIVFLIHGMGRKKSSMRMIESKLSESTDYRIIALQYPSREGSFEKQIALLRNQMTPHLDNLNHHRIHIVGHSLGGLLGLVLWSEISSEHQGHFVALGSPFSGSPWLNSNIFQKIFFEPYYGEIIPDLEKIQEILSLYDINTSSSAKMLIRGDVCPWYMNVLGTLYEVQEPHDCFITIDSAFDHMAASKRTYPVNHQELLSDPDILTAISDWISTTVVF
jgi:pimeloyl-ACP methyl ester carboxylesterase